MLNAKEDECKNNSDLLLFKKVKEGAYRTLADIAMFNFTDVRMPLSHEATVEQINSWGKVHLQSRSLVFRLALPKRSRSYVPCQSRSKCYR